MPIPSCSKLALSSSTKLDAFTEREATENFHEMISTWRIKNHSGEDRDMAARCIQECYDKETTDLDFEGLGLSSLPAILPPSVRKINLTNNNLTNFHEHILPLISKGIEVSYEGNPCCTIGNKSYKYEKIAQNTPILFQWSLLKENSAKYQNADCPMPPCYIDNILNTCNIETNRRVGIFISGVLTENQKKYLARLCLKQHNLEIIYADDIDFSDYGNKKCTSILSELMESFLTEAEKNNEPPEYIEECMHQYERVLKKMDARNPELTMFDVCTSFEDYNTVDFYRAMFMLK